MTAFWFGSNFCYAFRFHLYYLKTHYYFFFKSSVRTQKKVNVLFMDILTVGYFGSGFFCGYIVFRTDILTTGVVQTEDFHIIFRPFRHQRVRFVRESMETRPKTLPRVFRGTRLDCRISDRRICERLAKVFSRFRSTRSPVLGAEFVMT